MTYGKHRQGSTLAYRLDPRSKMIFSLVLMVATFLTSSWWGIAALAIAAAMALASSGIRPREVLATLRPFVWLLAFVLVFNSVFASAGWTYGLAAVARFAIVLLGTSSLMVTTSPTELTDGVSLLLMPLARLGVPTDDASLAVGMTLRFVPVVLDEFVRVRSAQEARFAHFGEGGLVARVRSYVPVLVPMFARALRRSRRLAYALENRGYSAFPGQKRTCIRSYQLRPSDVIVLLVCACVLVVGIAL